jgi:hypothetical protein
MPPRWQRSGRPDPSPQSSPAMARANAGGATAGALVAGEHPGWQPHSEGTDERGVDRAHRARAALIGL